MPPKAVRFFLPLLALVIFISSCKKDPDVRNTKDFAAYVEEYMEDENIPGVSVLIFNQQEIKYQENFGKANIAQNTAISDGHVFLLASVSKVITATALLQLYDDGQFQLNDKINDHLPFVVSAPNEPTDITFKMLLTHTSGIADGPSLDGQYYYGMDSPVALDSFLRGYLVPGGQWYDANENYHAFEPGTAHEYSNIGNALIAVLVEQISGMDFNTYCKQNIFVPMGMTNTFWRLDEISQPIVVPYNYANGDYEAIQNYTFTDYPNGGLRSNVSDLHKLLSAFTTGGTYNNYELLKASTVTEMYTPQIPSLDAEVGLHLFIMDKDRNLWGHDGGEQGVATIMAFHPTTGVGAILLSNQGEANLDAMLGVAYELGETL